MRSLFFIMSAVAVMGLAYWAYQENYRTQRALKDVAQLQAKIGQLRENLGVLKAEWAYLNRPERLAELADINFKSLRLMPLEPEQFGQIDQIAFPPKPLPPITTPIDVVGELNPSVEGQEP